MAVERRVRVAMIAYGTGHYHPERVRATSLVELAAVCDMVVARAAQATQDFPGTEGLVDTAAVLARPDSDLVVLAVPRNAHAELAIAAPAPASTWSWRSRCASRVPRRPPWSAGRPNADGPPLPPLGGDYRDLREGVAGGLIGEAFRVEMFGGGYGHPATTWRADKSALGGAFYDWGAHYVG